MQIQISFATGSDDYYNQYVGPFMTEVIEFTKTTWLQSVSGMSPFGAQVNDSRYQKEVMGTPAIRSRGTVGEHVAEFTGGMMATVYENGVPPYDLKPGLLSGRNVKFGKNGPYNTVPFRHGATKREAEGGHFDVMPKEVYNIVKKRYRGSSESWSQARPLQVTQKGDTIAVVGKKTGFRGHTSQDMNFSGQTSAMTKGHYLRGTGDYARETKTVMPRPGVVVPNWTPKTYTWVAGKYEGMIRQTKKYDKAVQSKYQTFRRVSEKSDPNSWWHPGFPKVPIMDGLGNFVQQKLPQLWENFTQQ